MGILGDLNEDEAHRTNDLSEPRAPAGEGPAMKDGQMVGPDEQMGSGGLESEKDQRSAFASGIPQADPSAHLRGSGESGNRANDRIGERMLEPPEDINSREQLSSQRSNGGLWLALMILVFALAGASSYFYLSLRNNNISLSDVTGLLKSINILGGRMGASEAKLRDLAANWDATANHLAELHRMRA